VEIVSQFVRIGEEKFFRRRIPAVRSCGGLGCAAGFALQAAEPTGKNSVENLLMDE
jgi:hypothetical protein